MRRLLLPLLLLALSAPALAQSPTEDELARAARSRAYLHTGVPLIAGSVLSGLDPTAEGSVLVLAGALASSYGLLVGPSMGAFYLDDHRRAWIGIGMRATGQVATGLGLVLILGGVFSGEENMALGGAVLTLGGIGLTVGGMAYSFATIPRSAREQAERLSQPSEIRLSTGLDPTTRRPMAGLVVTLH